MKRGDPQYPFADLLTVAPEYRLPSFKRLAKASLTIALVIVVTILVMAL